VGRAPHGSQTKPAGAPLGAHQAEGSRLADDHGVGRHQPFAHEMAGPVEPHGLLVAHELQLEPAGELQVTRAQHCGGLERGRQGPFGVAGAATPEAPAGRFRPQWVSFPQTAVAYRHGVDVRAVADDPSR
jgi:hypothetical protein